MATAYRIGPETARLQYRAFTIDDAPAFFALNGDPEVMRFTGEPVLESLQAAEQAIEAYPDFDDIGFGRWACVLKSTGKVIGFCGLKYLADLDLVDVGYRLMPDYWGQGLATEACAASLRFGFETLCLERIFGLVLPENLASVRVLEKSGMQPDGQFRYDHLDVLRFVKRCPGDQ